MSTAFKNGDFVVQADPLSAYWQQIPGCLKIVTNADRKSEHYAVQAKHVCPAGECVDKLYQTTEVYHEAELVLVYRPP